jgi:hypothetical protein
MEMFPLKVIRPGLLEIVGRAPGSATYYIPIRSIRSFAVHENPACIELHLGTVPSSGSIHTKVLFCTKEQLLDVVEFLTMCISSVGVLGTYASLENMKARIVNLERLYDEQNKEIDESIYSDSGIAEASDSGIAEASDSGIAEASDSGIAEASDSGIAEASDSGIAEASDSAMSEGSDIMDKPAYTGDNPSSFYCSLLIGTFTLAYFITWFMWISEKMTLHAH